MTITTETRAARAGQEEEQYQRVISGREQILEQLRKRGFRVTKQRMLILEVIFEYECASCKEIYYRAIQKDNRIGMATIYRMVNTLTDIGVLKETSLKPQTQPGPGRGCRITLRSKEVVELSEQEWLDMLSGALRQKGLPVSAEIAEVVIK